MQIEPFKLPKKKCSTRVSPLMTNLSPLMISLGAKKKFELACFHDQGTVVTLIMKLTATFKIGRHQS